MDAKIIASIRVREQEEISAYAKPLAPKSGFTLHEGTQTKQKTIVKEGSRWSYYII